MNLVWTIIGIAVVAFLLWWVLKKRKGGPVAPKGPTPPPAEGPEI
jgi:LPXTG-motif cell wall-anchored protein